MIHQFILAAPRPGMSASEFQDYWLHVHAVNYASKIPQITRYLIDSRLPVEAAAAGDPGLPHQGIAEIWLNNEKEQLASLQTPEFLQGARRDEPNWAAFWLTLVLDTTAYEVLPGAAPGGKDPDGVKLTVLSKRAPGLPLAEFRERSLDRYAPVLAKTPGVQRYLHAQTRDGFYGFGEAVLDSVDQLWFADVPALEAALASPYFTEQVRPARAGLSDPGYVWALVARENWVIGPEGKD
jgi:EthD domain